MNHLTREAFVKRYYGFIKNITKGTGIFPETIFAQAIIESQGAINGRYYVGASKLANLYNNYFGIKAGGKWKGASVNLKTGEVINNRPVTITDSFRVYGSFEESAKDYVKFIKENSRYAKAGVFSAPTYVDQAARIQAAGYATSPTYAKTVSQVASQVNDIIAKLPPEPSSGIITPENLAMVAGLTFFFI